MTKQRDISQPGKPSKKILKAAEDLILELGAENITITKIAQKAKVADSLAYQYFTGKEDIFYSVCYARLRDSIDTLKGHLEGIIDARSQLSKLISYGMKYNDVNKHYLLNLLFELRSSPEFYKTPIYQLFREHASIVLQILNRGVEEGVFRKDVNMRLVREIIYGVVDYEAITCIVTGEISELHQSWKDVMTLLLRMLQPPERSPVNERKDNILNAAETVFAEKGFSRATIGEIAKMANVAEGSIYNFFSNKEDLFSSVIDNHLVYNLKSMPLHMHPETPPQKLLAFILVHFNHSLSSSNFFKLYVIDALHSKRFYKSKAYESHKMYFQALEDIIEEGKADGSFYQDTNTRIFKSMFIGAFMNMAVRWIIFKDKNFDQVFEISELVKLMNSAICREASFYMAWYNQE